MRRVLQTRPVPGFSPSVGDRCSVDRLGWLHPFTWVSRVRCRVLATGKLCLVEVEHG